MRIDGGNIAQVWHQLLRRLLEQRDHVAPRGMKVQELTGVQLYVEQPRYNVLLSEERGLNYRFMVAEWLWIWFGRDDVKTIAQYNSQIAKFSDDGLAFSGAYGPPVHVQVPYVLEKLRTDRDSRQAVIDIYGQTRAIRGGAQPMAYPTKDVPCTLTLQFMIRDNLLVTVVSMRSSDVWLGLPYDFFNFSMIANCIAADLEVPLGGLTLNIGSSHLYETNQVPAMAAYAGTPYAGPSPQLPKRPPGALEHILVAPRTKSNLAQPWSNYARILAVESRADSKQAMLDLCAWAQL